MMRRRIITNDTPRLMLVLTEILGEDYWLQPGESLEVRAGVESLSADFELQETSKGITVWPGSDMDGIITVWQDDELLACGHQLPEGWP